MSSIRVNHLRLVVYPNDHPPPHAHVLGPGWELRIELSRPPALMTVSGKAKTGDIAVALMAVSDHLGTLRQRWRDLHE
ncbi:DUF4160 domain-containing protein [Tepidicella xavieri]|jgi:hypothetical protein|uniref:DUF4160 domain-containing protein n=1 Tax=Tepidicella xavieri TaxID=360241 RepID=UPI00105D830E|nr:DUF4160 domain-containing protein [Tepidicella xavieri]